MEQGTHLTLNEHDDDDDDDDDDDKPNCNFGCGMFRSTATVQHFVAIMNT